MREQGEELGTRPREELGESLSPFVFVLRHWPPTQASTAPTALARPPPSQKPCQGWCPGRLYPTHGLSKQSIHMGMHDL